FGFEAIPGISNNLGHPRRFVDEMQSENVIYFDSYELSKTWRLKPYHYGGILEPLVGVRWMRLRDINAFQSYSSALDTDQIPFTAFANAEQLITNTAVTENEMFAGQFGFRYYKFRDRFTFGTDMRVFFGGNWQNTISQQATEITSYDMLGFGNEVVFIIDRKSDFVHSRNEEFFFGFDVRGEVGYQLTKAISIRGGFQLIDIARGVWRGGDGTFLPGGDNDQDVLLVGGTFGISVNH
ncbi:MAG: BBP7 family outer membrane beta-barrel protein, partial [Pirellulales bacterium]|nr:BBP7 family outer membrane beta-barrel protein [Pirellulales bacterium]